MKVSERRTLTTKWNTAYLWVTESFIQLIVQKHLFIQQQKKWLTRVSHWIFTQMTHLHNDITWKKIQWTNLFGELIQKNGINQNPQPYMLYLLTSLSNAAHKFKATINHFKNSNNSLLFYILVFLSSNSKVIDELIQFYTHRYQLILYLKKGKKWYLSQTGSDRVVIAPLGFRSVACWRIS